MQIDPKPVYEYDQVLTQQDMLALLNGFVYQFNKLPRWRVWQRLQLAVAINVTVKMIAWLKNSKQTEVIK